MGIFASNQPDPPINWRNIVFLLAFAQIIIVRTIFLRFHAKTPIEYGLAFYTLASGSASAAALLICIWKKHQIFKALHNFEEFIAKSTWQSLNVNRNLRSGKMRIDCFGFLNFVGTQTSLQHMYNELNERIEKLSKLFYLFLVELASLGTMMPPLMISVVKCYILHLDPNESLQMPFPTV